ncbi:MAG: sulfur oxidation c-type cytochrome SoxA [Pseudomonadota bacterium]
MIRLGLILCLVVAAACQRGAEEAQIQALTAEEIQSGYAFLTPDTQALQDDVFANPGLLWVDRGADLFQSTAESKTSCASCHDTDLRGVAATYPAIDAASGQLLNLEGRINQCRTRNQGLEPLDYEHDDLLALTAYVAKQSHGMASQVDISGAAQPSYQRGRDYFLTRRGQFNLSCQQCHTENWGKQLRGDTISQGHGNGFPAYRLEWQSLGSLQRRLRDCDTGVRAEPLPFGDETYIALELYLAARSQGLALESPAVRR